MYCCHVVTFLCEAGSCHLLWYPEFDRYALKSLNYDVAELFR